jgi:hypothetical protein
MIRNALRLSRDQKEDRFIELRAKETPGEPVRQDGFEMREGIEMVPGTVHLVDSECTRPQKALRISRTDAPGACTPLCSLLTVLSARNLQPQASSWQQRRRRSYSSPTNDPDDPLNWSPLRKEYHFWLLIIWGILMAASVNWSGAVWVCCPQTPFHFTTANDILGTSLI